MRTILTFIFLITLLTGDLFGQTRTITGRIISEDLEALPVVSIQYPDTTLIEKTDLDGRFTVEINDATNFLLLSFVGFEWATIKISADCDTLEVVMMYDVIYDFMTARKIDRLRMKRYNRLPEIHRKAFDEGLFITESACYKQNFESYFND